MSLACHVGFRALHATTEALLNFRTVIFLEEGCAAAGPSKVRLHPLEVLVATDVAQRGLDIKEVNYVVRAQN